MDTESFPPTTPRPSAPEGPARVDRPFGSWLLGNSDDDDHRLRIRVRWLLAGSLFVANLVGMAVAMVLAIWVIPGPDVFQDKFAAINFIAVPVYVALAWTGITGLGIVTGLRVLRWAVRSAEGQELDERQRRATLRLPADLTVIQAVGWLGGLIVFTLLYG
ncbi:MAG: adenylate/guanylate cyclase domain-containing protein, partial [Thermocrispum sp.]